MKPSEKRPRMATLFRLQGGVCPYCGEPMQHPCEARARRVTGGEAQPGPMDPTLEHVTPRARGGSNELVNMLLVHRVCNERRGSGALPRRALSVWRRNVETIRDAIASGVGIHGEVPS